MTTDVEFAAALVVAVLAFALVALHLRRVLLFRRGARVACALRHRADRDWQGGVARFDPDALRAYRSIGVRLRPYAEIRRSDFAVGARRPARADDRRLFVDDPIVLSVMTGGAEVELALGSTAVPGLMAWVEGRPLN